MTSDPARPSRTDARRLRRIHDGFADRPVEELRRKSARRKRPKTNDAS